MNPTTLDIAIGTSAKTKVWKNQKWSWEDLAKKLMSAYKTHETYKEFINYSKQEQSDIKDIGGYVGGYLRAGRRKPQNVVHRQLLTLDIDFAHNYFWDDFCLQFDAAAVLHATHKHCKDSPRYRLVMPLSRECTPDEYVAISRQIAGLLGIDLFDNTTFQAERLMFWPSSSKDVSYYAKQQKGDWIHVESILDSYTDWTDSSSWPTSLHALTGIKNAATKQEDPETKGGVIGAFCKTYSIIDVIETFLQDVYAPTNDPGRFTYVNGSTSGGLTTYEDKFSFSHHGTDPTSMKLCNAFDLVRIHKFGHLETRKSFTAMQDFCRKDKQVKKTLATEKLSEAKYEFAEELEEDEDAEDWLATLEIDGKGVYLSTASNISLIFANDTRLKEAFSENSFDNRKYVMRTLPWRAVPVPETIKNVDLSGIRNYIESIYGITGMLKIEDSLNLEFEKHSFHPIKDYLEGLTWDEEKRVDTLLIDYFGAEDTIYSKESIRKALVASVARVYNPGVKFDLVLTLVGEQGTGKSTFIHKLGKDWFSDTFTTVHGKEAFEQLHGAWLVEIAELSGLRKADIETIKHFISKQEDMFRPAYGRTVETYKRQCIFFGTTNNKDFLRDPSGNRRFMPVDVNRYHATKDIFSTAFEEEIDQIWAEAKQLYEKKEKLYLSKDAEHLAKIEQLSHSETDEREGLIIEFLDRKLPKSWESLDIYGRRMFLNDEKQGNKIRDIVCIGEIWCECLEKDKQDMTRYNTRGLNDILRNLPEWEPINSTKNFKLYGTQKYFTRRLM